ncbi:MAG: PDZ domain-containing protein [Pirellulaceae bacterium]
MNFAQTIIKTNSFNWQMLAIVLCALNLCSAIANGQTQTEDLKLSATDQVKFWLDQVESPQFDVRSQATIKLGELGADALRQIVEKTINGSPETQYRTSLAIEQIAVTADEPDFLKAAAILRVISASNTIDERLDQLRATWKQQQTDKAIKKLRDAGARVQVVQRAGNGIDDVDVRILISEFGDESQKVDEPEGTPREPRLTREQLSERVEQILTGTFTENYEIAFPRGEEDSTREELLSSIRANMIRNQLRAGMNLNMLSELKTTVEFGPNWKGDLDAFTNIVGIEGLGNVFFDHCTLHPEYFDVLKRVSELECVRFADVDWVSGASERIGELVSVQILDWRGELSKDNIEQLIRLPTMRMLSLDVGELDPDLLSRLKGFRHLVSLCVVGAKLDQGVLDAVSTVPALNQFCWSACTFKLSDFHRFQSMNPQVSCDPQPLAFLGVRGPNNFGDSNMPWCRISEVIDDSSAAKAGLQVGDIVRKINGQKIEGFNDLQLMVSQFRPNEKITLEVERNDQMLELNATLGDRSQAYE